MDGVPQAPQRRHAITSSREPASVRFSVLGPVRAWDGETALSSGSPQQRAVLAALLLRQGETVTATELIDALWGNEPPSQALAAVRTYASRLRKVLGPKVLVSESGGYAIWVPEGALDVMVAQDLTAAAERAKSAGDLPFASELLGRALALWEGEALAGVPGTYAETQRSRLEEWRLQLREARLDMELARGHHAEAVSELTALTAAHPLRERLRELLMLALYRSGRQAEALAVYADTRRLLAEELGMDPSPGLSQLQQRILRADLDLAEPPAPTGEPVTSLTVEPTVSPYLPAQLPATVTDFTGRASLVTELGDALASAEGRAMTVSALAGIGGVGKTALAVHVARKARASFPGGQLYVDLQGGGPSPVEPGSVLGSFLRALGTPDSAIPDSLEERAALYRSALDGRRVLVLLDNARDAAQVRPLLPGSEGCAALVTSRVRMYDLAGAHLVDLDVMAPEEALVLFTKIVGEERVASEREAASEVVAACGLLPLAIRIAASRLAARRTWTVAVLAAKLADEHRRLGELQAGDLAVRAAFEFGYGQLRSAQARAFRLLSLADGPGISVAAAAAMLELSAEETEYLLESLVDTSLLDSVAPGRYRYHDLVRLYARARAEQDEQPPSERGAAMSRLLDFYLATAARVFALERPGDRMVDHLEPTNSDGLRFHSRETALDWLYTEAVSVIAAAQQACMSGELRKAGDLLLAVRDVAESGSNFNRYEATVLTLLKAATESRDERTEVRARAILASLHSLMGRFQEAEREAREAARLSRSTGDTWATAEALNRMGIIALYQSRHEDGETSLAQAIECFRTLGDHPGEAGALCNLSRIHLATGRQTSAVALAQQGVDLYDALGNSLRGASGRYALALAFTQSGQLECATTRLKEALTVFQESRQRLWEGMTLFRLAEVDLAASRPAQAASNAERALTLMRGIGGEWRRANILVALGHALSGIGQAKRAQVTWRDALEMFESSGAPEAELVRSLLAENHATLSS